MRSVKIAISTVYALSFFVLVGGSAAAEEKADVAAPATSSAASIPDEAASASGDVASPAGCPHAGDGPCCTSCRKKLARQAESTEAAAVEVKAAAEVKAECPCQRARRLAEGG